MVPNSMNANKVKKNCILWTLGLVYVGNICFIVTLEYVSTTNTIGFRCTNEILFIKSNKSINLIINEIFLVNLIECIGVLTRTVVGNRRPAGRIRSIRLFYMTRIKFQN
uniref:Uncharacterized protein n=1 Tax=Sipha flava TaxID=143950 RepID=A0A2S2R9D9_9HEMI